MPHIKETLHLAIWAQRGPIYLCAWHIVIRQWMRPMWVLVIVASLFITIFTWNSLINPQRLGTRLIMYPSMGGCNHHAFHPWVAPTLSMEGPSMVSPICHLTFIPIISRSHHHYDSITWWKVECRYFCILYMFLKIHDDQRYETSHPEIYYFCESIKWFGSWTVAQKNI